MMKSIKNRRQLKAAQKALLQRQAELEKAIRYDWRDVKESLKPENFTAQLFSGACSKNKATNGHDFMADSAAEFAASLTREFVQKAASKVGNWFKK